MSRFLLLVMIEIIVIRHCEIQSFSSIAIDVNLICKSGSKTYYDNDAISSCDQFQFSVLPIVIDFVLIRRLR